jgi:hypothetical protein
MSAQHIAPQFSLSLRTCGCQSADLRRVYNGRLVTEVPAPHSELLVKSLSRLLLLAALLPTIANENALHPINRSVRITVCHLPKPACICILLRAASRLVSARERERVV